MSRLTAGTRVRSAWFGRAHRQRPGPPLPPGRIEILPHRPDQGDAPAIPATERIAGRALAVFLCEPEANPVLAPVCRHAGGAPLVEDLNSRSNVLFGRGEGYSQHRKGEGGLQEIPEGERHGEGVGNLVDKTLMSVMPVGVVDGRREFVGRADLCGGDCEPGELLRVQPFVAQMCSHSTA